MELRFSKMQGLGNDFIVVDDREAVLDLAPEAVVWLCDRNFGIGADGVMLLRAASGPDADYAWEFFNADGSKPEQCGNGSRCFARYVADKGLLPPDGDTVRLETLAGVTSIKVNRDAAGAFESATVDMGEPILHPALIPAKFGGEFVYECPVETEAGEFRVTAVSMGNPHAVLWVDDVETAPVETAGPVIETDPHFPNKTNVEFAQLVSDDRIALRVWERGVGETLACGTGACATLVASVLGCRTGRSAVIELPGGELEVEWAEDEHVYLTGPAVIVFEGVLTIGEED